MANGEGNLTAAVGVTPARVADADDTAQYQPPRAPEGRVLPTLHDVERRIAEWRESIAAIDRARGDPTAGTKRLADSMEYVQAEHAEALASAKTAMSRAVEQHEARHDYDETFVRDQHVRKTKATIAAFEASDRAATRDYKGQVEAAENAFNAFKSKGGSWVAEVKSVLDTAAERLQATDQGKLWADRAGHLSTSSEGLDQSTLSGKAGETLFEQERDYWKTYKGPHVLYLGLAVLLFALLNLAGVLSWSRYGGLLSIVTAPLIFAGFLYLATPDPSKGNWRNTGMGFILLAGLTIVVAFVLEAVLPFQSLFLGSFGNLYFGSAFRWVPLGLFILVLAAQRFISSPGMRLAAQMALLSAMFLLPRIAGFGDLRPLDIVLLIVSNLIVGGIALAKHGSVSKRLDRLRALHAWRQQETAKAVNAADAERQAATARAEQERQRIVVAATKERDAARKDADEIKAAKERLVASRFAADQRSVEGEFAEVTAALHAGLATSRQSWGRAGAAITAEADAASPQWSSLVRCPDTSAAPEVQRIGTLTERRESQPIALPATIAFPEGLSLYVRASKADREAAIEGIEALAMRLLLQVPPAGIEFTFFDPVGLGKSVAGVMPVTDTNPDLVNSRAWSEPGDAQRLLMELTSRISLVHQKYLRSEYPDIRTYNERARIPEPYHVLVVLDYPSGFSEELHNRLLSVMEAGPTCGIVTIVLHDPSLKAAYGVTPDDVAGRAQTVLVPQNGRFVFEQPRLPGFTLAWDEPPAAAEIAATLQEIGTRAEKNAIIEVPFREFAPPPETWWAPTATTATGLSAVVGIAGTRTRQELALGKDTSQHVLVAGRTGSGKSTLLQVIIMSLALKYDPHELQLYLIDFKNGVGFKRFAGRLPHARVLAIETEREFGLSVLEGLDAEMTSRGKLFKEVEAQDLAAYRAHPDGGRMPRILLMVDEFQEFFVEDDVPARKAAMLLDRLVRQGRAFGIHVLLGSQTLAGAYSLARSTIDQMGVRIALQCSDEDSRLILSANNPAAGLLTRSGEAIYNDANGRVEGNELFQTLWLSDDERLAFLDEVAAKATDEAFVAQQIVFDGKELAELPTNEAFRGELAQPAWSGPRHRAVSGEAWLGDPIAIRWRDADQTVRQPVLASFRRQSGSNLLIAGQQEDAALGIETAALLTLALQIEPKENEPTFHAIDLSPVDHPANGSVAALLESLPHGSSVPGRRRVADALVRLALEVERRLADDEGQHPPIVFLFHGLMRSKDLRDEDSSSLGGFSFGFDGQAPPSPSPRARLTKILRDGPDVGVHSIVWCDTLANLSRVMDSRGMREFDMRIAFQMATEDSHLLIDDGSAGKLGPNRAVFVSEDLGIRESFRPFGLADREWLIEQAVAIRDRAAAIR